MGGRVLPNLRIKVHQTDVWVEAVLPQTLLRIGEEVRALGRSESKLAELKSAGAEVFTGDVRDAAFLAKTFHGADVPTDRRSPDYRARQDQEGEAVVESHPARPACGTSSL